VRPQRFASIARDVAWLLIPAVCLVALTVGLGYLVTEVLPSTAIGKWDAEVPRRLVEHRQQEGVSESKLITSLSETPTIVALTAIAAALFRWMFGRWRESLVIIYAVVGETSIFLATTLLIDRPRPDVPKLDAAPPTSSFPSGHTAAAVCFYGSVAAIILWHPASLDQGRSGVRVRGGATDHRRQPRVSRNALPDRCARRRAARRDLADRRHLLCAHP
jgi:undecaprenyl-diphosphatase